MKKIILVALMCLCIVGCGSNGKDKDKKIDNTDLSSKEVQEYLEKEGYEFLVSDNENTQYTIISKDNIWIQKIVNNYIGNFVTFQNDKINDEHASIVDEKENDTDELKEQYNGFLKWLESVGLDKSQITDVLDYYDSENRVTTSPSTDSYQGNDSQSTPQDTTTLGQKNALQKAREYLSVMSFSQSGLIKQLEYEGFSNEEATYAVNNCIVDWNEQAAKKAKEYIDTMSFSRNGLIDQLKYEGFSQEQAEYGVSAIGY